MKFTLENCERVLDAADALLTTLSARGTGFQSASDAEHEATALEALRQAFIMGGFTGDIIPGGGPGELPAHVFMQIKPLWEWLKALHDRPGSLQAHIPAHRATIEGIRSILSGIAAKPDSHAKHNVSNIGKTAREKIVKFFREKPRPEWKTLEEITRGIGSNSEPYTAKRLRELVGENVLGHQKGKGLWRLIK